MKLSKWTHNSEETFDQLLNTISNFKTWWQPDIDPLTKSSLAVNIKKVFQENQIININSTDITYNYIEYEYERIRPGEESNDMRSTRVYPIRGFIIIYTDGISTQFITNRSVGDNAKTIIRKLINASKNLEITPQNFKITEDMFIWMIYKVLNRGENSLDEDTHLILKRIIGFRGATNDKLSEVKGSGNTILNLLSTLAFLFENERVSYITPSIEYEKNTIELSLDFNGNVDIDFSSYVGDYLLNDEYTTNSSVILLTFLEILPKVIAAYKTDCNNKEWSEEIKVKFFTGIGESIKAKIKEKMSK